jgi:myo-inositol-1(or 4)-monophosphatase
VTDRLSPPAHLSVKDVFGPPPAGEDPLLAELASVALAAAEGAAALAADGFGRRRAEVDTKSSATDMVSEIDRGAEALISTLLSRARPDDGLLGEEGASREGTSGIRWVVDPLDGTTNYLFGIPCWSVSVAAERRGRAVVGVVADPNAGEVWAAVEGRGARCNGAPIRVAEGRSDLGTALVATGFGYRAEQRAWQAEVTGRVLPKVRDIRRFGSAALDLCWVAGGRFDAYYEWDLNRWDYSAGTIICREAGGIVDTLAGRLVVATTPSLTGPLAELLDASGAMSVPPRNEPAGQ